GTGAEAFASLDRGDREAALDALLDELGKADEGTREDLRRTIIGILSEADPADPTARHYRKRLATALF
ncbi:MAG TPA: tetratricopeptide repeat protein, partial [Solirubrobacterales bacterium]|nr:tetratricopeptide repeat protein [Solirubrobacterales bacterium]